METGITFRMRLTLIAVACTACSGPLPSGLAPLPNAAAHDAVTHATESVIYSFTGQDDGGDPAADLVFGPSGKLYGTTVLGGASACGTVFALTAKAGWHESVLYHFPCHFHGKNPYGGVLFDLHGNAYGTTASGGFGPSCEGAGCGVAFQLQGSSESVLHDFTGGNDGFGPGNGLVADEYGNLFGTTPDGGAYSQGVLYELFNHAGKWRERVLHTFTGGGDGGGGSLGRLIVENTDTIYGVEETGGAYGYGTVFRLAPTSKGGWRLSTLYAFKGTPDCASPYGGLLENALGNLHGTTYGGGTNGYGCVFELVAKAHYAEHILYSFKGGADGSFPTSTLAKFGREGLLGTTSMGGGACDCGTIFALKPPGRERIIHAFTGGTDGDGAYPYYGLTSNSVGEFYGTTAAGGRFNHGTVFFGSP